MRKYSSLYILGCIGMVGLGLLFALSQRLWLRSFLHPIHYWAGFISSLKPYVIASDSLYKTLIFPSSDRAFYGVSIAKEGYLVYPCAMSKMENSPIGICLLDPTENSSKVFERIISDPKNEHADLFGPQADGHWVIYGRESNPLQIIATNLESGERVIVGDIDSGQVDHPVGPFYALSNQLVAWVDERNFPKQGRQNIVKVFDLTTRMQRTLFEVPPHSEIDRIAMDGDHIVYSESKVALNEGETSNVYLYKISTGERQQLTTSGTASQPSISFPYVVWKTNTHFSTNGGIFLYDFRNQQGSEIIRADGFPKTYDWPSISHWGLAYIQNGGAAPVWFYHIPSGQIDTINESGGFTEIAGHYMAWAGHHQNCPASGPACLFWADISQKMASK